MAKTVQADRSRRRPVRPLMVFPAMSIEDHEALRDWWQQNGGLLSRCFRNGLFENLVKHNLSLARLAELTPLRLFSYLRACQSDSRELIRAAQVFPRDQY